MIYAKCFYDLYTQKIQGSMSTKDVNKYSLLYEEIKFLLDDYLDENVKYFSQISI